MFRNEVNQPLYQTRYQSSLHGGDVSLDHLRFVIGLSVRAVDTPKRQTLRQLFNRSE